MSRMHRREFIGKAAAMALATGMSGRLFAEDKPSTAPAAATSTRPAGGPPLRLNDQVKLGKTGIETSRLSLGTGTVGGKEQRDSGEANMIRMFRTAMDNGIRWWDAADMYKSHPYIARTLKEVQRDKVVITSKTQAKDADGVRKDLERFRQELNTDYIDILLLHCMMDGDWPEKMRGPMDVLSEAKEKGIVRAVGCSCHTFEALRAAMDEPWVEVDLARINPFAIYMDVKTPEEVGKVDETLATMHQRGKSIYGMKILGEGRIKGDRIDESLRFALSKPYLSGFTIGFSSLDQINDIARRVERVQAEG